MYTMNTCAFLLILSVQIYADGIEGPTAAGCTFEEDSDPNLCDFTQGEDDDFDWMLFRTYSSPSASSDLLRVCSTVFQGGRKMLL
ncbi:receptor-type tyrosine-protein phosphatase U-like [Poecilia latipinna]|uniref:receptor-type tyrosine-protein phosphatase U-like n=1 Tax=Poecilia latipinna TaxID=48699 RepID=UPI00072EB5E7|nr:PREDICTED: receptor-type tyrosine-protein phosphatase U-like [Poecilia latipinna]